MFSAHAWVIVRSSREKLRDAIKSENFSNIDEIDIKIDEADAKLFDDLEMYLKSEIPNLVDYTLTRQLNNDSGILRFSSSTNHRRSPPNAIQVLEWVKEHGPDSYGLLYVHDDEDEGEWAKKYGRTGENFQNVFRVWVLKNGVITENEDFYLSPVPDDLQV